MCLHKWIFLVIFILFATITALPPRKVTYGPCVGMDCLHGVLMHGDSKSGHAHSEEDKLKSKVDNAQERLDRKKTPPAQMDQEQYLHGVLMHGDAKPGEHHEHKDMKNTQTLEKTHQKDGPIDQEQYLHGVMMHGDSKPGESHEYEDKKLTEKKNITESVTKGPLDQEKYLHDVVMHGSKNVDHSKEKVLDNSKSPTVQDTRQKQDDLTTSSPQTTTTTTTTESPMHPSELEKIQKRKGWLQQFWDYWYGNETNSSKKSKQQMKGDKVHKEVKKEPVHDMLSDVKLVGDSGPVEVHDHQRERSPSPSESSDHHREDNYKPEDHYEDDDDDMYTMYNTPVHTEH